MNKNKIVKNIMIILLGVTLFVLTGCTASSNKVETENKGDNKVENLIMKESNNSSINENNTNNTNSMDNSTNNTTKSTSKTTSKDTSSKSSSFSSDTINGEKITGIYPSYDEDYERIATATNKYYRNKKTGVIYKRHLDDDGVYRYY